MKSPVLTRLLGAAMALVALTGVAAAQADTDWPKTTVKVIVPYPPGGANDTVARP